ncbi:MAG: hypothetical protein ABMA64_21675 [Myxococcota bacterium]
MLGRSQAVRRVEAEESTQEGLLASDTVFERMHRQFGNTELLEALQGGGGALGEELARTAAAAAGKPGAPAGAPSNAETNEQLRSRQLDGQAPETALRLLRSNPAVGEFKGWDGQPGDLSQVDLNVCAGALAEQVGALRDSPDEARELVWFLYELANPVADPGRQRVCDLQTGALYVVAYEPAEGHGDAASGCFALGSQLTHRDRWIDSGDAIGPADPSQGARSFEDTLPAALEARDRLIYRHAFDVDDRTLGPIRAQRHLLDPGEVDPFVDDYLTAFYVNGARQTGLRYAPSVKADPVGAFFRDPPACDLLPDGRGIIDCKGFAMVSEVLYDCLLGASDGPQTEQHTWKFAIAGATAHQLLLRWSDDGATVVDDDELRTVALEPDDLAYLREVAEATGGAQPDGWIDLDRFRALRRACEGLNGKFSWFDGTAPVG